MTIIEIQDSGVFFDYIRVFTISWILLDWKPPPTILAARLSPFIRVQVLIGVLITFEA